MTRRQSGRAAHGGSGLTQRLRARLRAAPIPEPRTIVLGFSGGSDSLALAAVLATICRDNALAVLAVHVDHGLRDESGVEQTAAATLASELGIEFRGVGLHPGLQGRHPGVGVEEAARRERYEALALVAREEGASVIALAHHASDQAETVLLHLLRGSGLHGGSGMAEWTKRTIPWWRDDPVVDSFWIWRPFLSETKETLQTYVSDLDVLPVHDPSNARREFTRNRIRHDILPLLAEISVGATVALGRFASLVAADDDYLDGVAVQMLESVGGPSGGLSAGRLLSEHVAIQRRVVRLWLASRIGGGVEIGQNRIEAVLALARSGAGNRWVEIGGGWGVTMKDGHLDCRLDGPT